MVDPWPSLIVGLALMPWLALLIAARSPAYCLAGRTGAGLWTAGMVPALALAVLGLGADGVVRDWPALLVVALIAGAAITALVNATIPGLRAIAKRRTAALLFVFCCMCGYAYGGILLANIGLDAAPGETFRAAVLGKRSTSGRSSTRWVLHLAPWGSQTEPSEVSVRRAVYNAVGVGDSVCVDLRPGALGLTWYAVVRCEDTRA